MTFNKPLIYAAVATCLLLSTAGAEGWSKIGGPAGGRGAMAQGYLGIMFHDIPDADVSTLRLKDKHGAEIIMVDHDGPAGKAGLRVRDVVLRLNGTSIDGEDQLRKSLHDLQPGRVLAITICRDGVEQTLSATLSTREEVIQQAQAQRWSVPAPVDDAELPAPEQTPPSSITGRFSSFISPGHLLPSLPIYTGAMVDAMGQQLADYFGVKDGKGLLVHAVEMNSPAAAAGLHAGDVVVRMNGTRVRTEKDWTRSLHENKGKAIAITVVRDRREQTLTMMADGKKRSAVEIPSSLGDGGGPLLMLR